jgi:hypothetical protein
VRRLLVEGVVDGGPGRGEKNGRKRTTKKEEKEGEGRRMEAITPPQKALTRRRLNTTEGVEENH